jgi:hypothetical protein
MFHADGRTDGRTDRTKLIAAFRSFATAPTTIMLKLKKMSACPIVKVYFRIYQIHHKLILLKCHT